MSSYKLYQISTNTEEEWDALHAILVQDSSLENNIPSRAVECTDYKWHSPTRSTYLLTEDEAGQLSQHPSIKFINIDYTSYPEEFKPPPKEIQCDTYRYANTVLNYRNWYDYNGTLTATNSRAGYQLLRCSQQGDPWYGQAANTVIVDRIPQSTTGAGVDVVVSDDGCWFGHVEFQRNATSPGPANYTGGNPLPGNGTCDLLDLVLEGPYYIDPAWFDASAGTRLTTRWDNTTVPVESEARAWWSNSSNRSAGFANAGTVSISDNYTRAFNNGNNTTVSSVGGHGTPCAALAYGRTQGWAYNANKWFVQSINTFGTDIEPYFDILKIFHTNKPINNTYGNKNPTIASNSWGYRATVSSTGVYYHRQDGSGSGGVSYTGTKPGFMYHVEVYADANRMKGEMVTNSLLEAGEELINSGVIFVVAAGNGNQKQVGYTHSDYNNYFANALSVPLTSATHLEFGVTCYNTTNRRGFPQQLGKTANNVYPVINVGALDDGYQTVLGKEWKVNYSDMGEEIDCYAPADGTLAAIYSSSGQVRSDSFPGGTGTTGSSSLTGIFTSNARISGANTFLAAANTSYRFNSTSSSSGTISLIDSSFIGRDAFANIGESGLNYDSSPDVGNNDDGYWPVSLPWDISFLGTTYNIVYIGTNTYVTFGEGSVVYSSLTASNPPYPKIMMTSADNSCQRFYGQTNGVVSGTAPNRTFTIRWEGTNAIGGTSGSPNMVYEMKFYETNNTQIDIHMGVNARYTPSGSYFDNKFSGTSAACPVAAGLIATILESKRTWTYADVRSWLQTRVVNQDSNVFYQGSESTTANAASWSDVNSLEGGAPRVIYQAGSDSSSTFQGITLTGTGLTIT